MRVLLSIGLAFLATAIIVLIFFVISASFARADEGSWELRATGGAAVFEPNINGRHYTRFDDVSWGWTAEGVRCLPDSGWCFGLEIANYRANVKGGFPLSENRPEAQGSTWALTGNVYYEVDFTDWFILAPYGGLGMGFIGYDPADYDGYRLKDHHRAANLGDVGLQSQGGVMAKIFGEERCFLLLHLIRYTRTDFASRTGVDHESGQQIWYSGGGVGCRIGG